MNAEKMRILNMLQDGKINADEAANLLAVMDKPGKPAPEPKPSPSSPSASARPAGNNGPTTAKSTVDFAELKEKFSTIATNLEPTLKKVTETTASTIMKAADKLSDVILEASSSVAKSTESGTARSAGATGATGASGAKNSGTRTAPRPARGASGATGATGTTELQTELTIAPGYNELSLACLNGFCKIQGYNGDKINASIFYKGKTAPELIRLGSKYYLNYDEENLESVSIDAYVPEHMFKVISLSNINGQLDVSSLAAEQIEISNTGGRTGLDTINAANLKSESGNGSLRLANISGETIVIEHFNGVADASEIDAANLSFVNFNGNLSVQVSRFGKYSEYLWQLETSNAKLSLNVPTMPDLGYHIKAASALGQVKLGLTGMEFITNQPGAVEARNANFADRPTKVRLALETSGDVISVN